MGLPNFRRRPIGSCPGQIRAATSSLTTATSVAPARSRSVPAGELAAFKAEATKRTAELAAIAVGAPAT